LFGYLQAHVTGQLVHGIAGDTPENRGRGRWGEQPAVLDQEQVFAGALTKQAVRSKPDTLIKSAFLGFETNELTGQVVTPGLGAGRHGVRCETLPGSDAGANSIPEALFAEISAPEVNDDDCINLVDILGDHPETAGTTHDQWPEIGAFKTGLTQCFKTRFTDLFEAVVNGNPVYLGRIKQAFQVVIEAKNGRTFGGLVSTNAFKNRRAVMQCMTQDVYLAIVKVTQFTVEPNLVVFAHFD